MCMDYEASEQWYKALQQLAADSPKGSGGGKLCRSKLTYLDIALPQRGSQGIVDILLRLFHVLKDKPLRESTFSVTSTLPSLMNGGKDFCAWSKRDDVLATTLAKPLTAVLGADGVGLADCALCESKFEKGEEVSQRMFALMSRMGEVQAKGTADMEFAILGLLARMQIKGGKAENAQETLENLKEKFLAAKEKRFMGNLNAALCRVDLYLGNERSEERRVGKEC